MTARGQAAVDGETVGTVPRRNVTLALLGVGYAGYYLCRVLFSVARPLLIEEMVRSGSTAADATLALGAIASWSLLASALGKFLLGPLADTVGGRRCFLSGMALVAAGSVAFGLGAGPSAWLGAWCFQRFVQPLGWPGLLKITARWTSPDRFGAVLGVLSLSWLAGDAAARAFHGYLFANGVSWRGACFVAAGTLSALALVYIFALKEGPGSSTSPGQTALRLPDLRGTRGASGGRPAVGRLLSRPAFWMICALSLTLTLLREALMEWAPTYLALVGGLSGGAAAQRSALFPLLGAVSALATGWLGDRLGRRGRAAMIGVGAATTGVLFLALAAVPAGNAALASALIGAIGLALIGPYAFVISNVALDLGGDSRGATASSIVDGVGSLGAILAGRWVAELAVRLGWSGAFQTLAGIAAVGAVAALGYRWTLRGDR